MSWIPRQRLAGREDLCQPVVMRARLRPQSVLTTPTSGSGKRHALGKRPVHHQRSAAAPQPPGPCDCRHQESHTVRADSSSCGYPERSHGRRDAADFTSAASVIRASRYSGRDFEDVAATLPPHAKPQVRWPERDMPPTRPVAQSETCQATHPNHKTAGQAPFSAGSKIATHSTCEVIGKMST